MRYVIGIDEVGRGPLAGPVVVCALAMPDGLVKRAAISCPGGRGRIALRDSKKLSEKQREAWFEYLTSHPKISYAVARVYPRQIEKRNISGAANMAAYRAVSKLLKDKTCQVYLDGGLFVKNKFYSRDMGARTVIKGDEKMLSISAASVIAKVTRDRMMFRLARKYPGYGFDVHKGYGTKAHLEALRKLGPCDMHRSTFLGSRNKLD